MQFKLAALFVALVSATAVMATPSPAPAGSLAQYDASLTGGLAIIRDCHVCRECSNGSSCCGGCSKPNGCCPA
ncbi:unnamed protein product [Tilletia controversa]|uniref:Uncharacterized protein n=4 Tax=Tilletia TaxID=13289 RepID=A0A8X7SWN7_9BASI|nr:hypothetical protein CF336_g8706 [Tilletia laevis]KAE8190633.1 hypothetical protein CF328_g5915 [Tilletia controversa]KAE8240845.1 hypothetical protein A4X03_0g8302 [Tilletia caries]KAE8183342.1 hypothetical protein CF335_g8349 [Tilletia laevis]KAE8247690.1 hypothetical protein A4X06_0g4260 [Tilletia controversa]